MMNLFYDQYNVTNVKLNKNFEVYLLHVLDLLRSVVYVFRKKNETINSFCQSTNPTYDNDC